MSDPLCSVGGLAEHLWGGGDLEWELGDPVQPQPGHRLRNTAGSADGIGDVPRLIDEKRSWGPPAPRNSEAASRMGRVRRYWVLSCLCSRALLGWAFPLYKLGKPKKAAEQWWDSDLRWPGTARVALGGRSVASPRGAEPSTDGAAGGARKGSSGQSPSGPPRRPAPRPAGGPQCRGQLQRTTASMTC